jgi:signal transduction histidine kinase
VFPAGWWAATVHLLLGLPIGVVTFTATLTLVALTIGLLPTAFLAFATGLALLWSVRAFTAVQRSRFRSLLGVDIAADRGGRDGSWLRRTLRDMISASTWRQITYHLLALGIGVLGFVVVSMSWGWALAMSTVIAYQGVLPERGIFGWHLHSAPMLAAITAAGLVLLLCSPLVALGLAYVDSALARVLLGPSRARALAMRMQTLERSRADVVDAADAERRRIERDLHDGTQQRLVSLAMNLGMARTQLTELPEPAREAIAQAHDEAKQALTELRDFVRGLHPAVLDDRGLDAALSGIAARAPLPVRLTVDVPTRCSPTIEAIAYFVVSESLTNVAKHAHATHVTVTLRRTGDRLHIRVSDDGRGGATEAAGRGLAGLAQRAASVDGTMHVQSPPGGPTVIEVDLPCES